MVKLVLIRHGQTEWNLRNLFSGWTDVGLSPNGVREVKEVGELLKERGFSFDLVFTSVLRSANQTTDLLLESMGQKDLPVIRSWRLNERHYGALQGLNKAETARHWGDEQANLWRRSLEVAPPALEKADERWPGNQTKYRQLIEAGEMTEDDCPLSESLLDTKNRLEPFFMEKIVPELKAGKKILIVAHGNVLRALAMILDHLTPEQVRHLEIRNANPHVLELDETTLNVIKEYSL